FAMRTTAATTSWRWAHADASGWNAKRTGLSPWDATATSCASLRPRNLAAAALVAALALVAGWNAYKYPSGAGYDVRQHREYADLLIHHGEIPGPGSRSEYYTPPLFYALAGAATVVGEHVHPGDPHKLGQVLNWIVLLAAALVLWLLVRELFPARPWLPLLLIAAATALIAAPSYIRQTIKYGDPVFDRPTKHEAIWERRPARFYVGLGLPQVFSAPIRPHFVNQAVPTTYSEIWGDYFGVWRGSRERQAFLGLLPTLLAVGGWLVLLVRSRRIPARLPAVLLPGLGVLGYLYFTVSYP